MQAIISENSNETTTKKLIYGVGINDGGNVIHWEDNGKRVKCKVYACWYDMLERCYSEVYQSKRPTYKGCSVCDEWLIFSNFKHWMELQSWHNKQLDKDLLSPGNKIYSPENCIFVTPEINILFTHEKSDQGRYPAGVTFFKPNKTFRSRIRIYGKAKHLGYFDNPIDAHIKYQTAKIEHAYEIATNEPDERVANAIRGYCQTFEYFFLAEVSL